MSTYLLGGGPAARARRGIFIMLYINWYFSREEHKIKYVFSFRGSLHLLIPFPAILGTIFPENPLRNHEI